MLGREATSSSKVIGEWVLWGLAGQDEIASTQLAVGVLDCLRRVDDIAYLRWACVAKNIDSVTVFRDEARGLSLPRKSRHGGYAAMAVRAEASSKLIGLMLPTLE